MDRSTRDDDVFEPYRFFEPSDPDGFGLGEFSGSGADRRWPWLAGLGVLAALAVSGLVWMLAHMPRPIPAHVLATQSPSVTATAGLSTSDAGVPSIATWPTVSAAGKGVPTPLPTIAVTSISAVRTPPPPRPSTTGPLPPTRRVPPPAVVAVPNVVGQRQAAASLVLRAAGFRVAAVPVVYARPRDSHRVLAQFPAGGTTAPRGSLVTIYVGA